MSHFEIMCPTLWTNNVVSYYHLIAYNLSCNMCIVISVSHVTQRFDMRKNLMWKVLRFSLTAPTSRLILSTLAPANSLHCEG